jgi:hypothetical protein
LIIIIQGLCGFQVKSSMVVNINCSYTANLQSPFCLIGKTGPEIANTGCFLAGFDDIAWIKGNGKRAATL